VRDPGVFGVLLGGCGRNLFECLQNNFRNFEEIDPTCCVESDLHPLVSHPVRSGHRACPAQLYAKDFSATHV